MKQILFIPFCLLFILPIYAQEKQDSTKKQKEFIILSGEEELANDSIKTIPKYPEKELILIKSKTSKANEDLDVTIDGEQFFFIGKKSYGNIRRNVDSDRLRIKGGVFNNQNSNFKGHWRGFYYGFVNFSDLPKSHSDLKLDFGGSFAMQFNFCRYSIGLSPRDNFGLVTGLGFEYQRLRFSDNNVSILKAGGDIATIKPMDEYPNMAEIKRSVFKTLYLTIPLLMEVQFPAQNRRSDRVYVAAGIMGGVRLHSKTKIVYDDNNGDKQKKKNKSNFNLVPVKADVTTRIGYKSIFAWSSYSLTNLFSTDNTPNLHLSTIGVGVTF